MNIWVISLQSSNILNAKCFPIANWQIHIYIVQMHHEFAKYNLQRVQVRQLVFINFAVLGRSIHEASVNVSISVNSWFQCIINNPICETYYTTECKGYGYQNMCYQKPNYRCYKKPTNCWKMPKFYCRYVPMQNRKSVPEQGKRIVSRRMCGSAIPKEYRIDMNTDCLCFYRKVWNSYNLLFNETHKNYSFVAIDKFSKPDNYKASICSNQTFKFGH